MNEHSFYRNLNADILRIAFNILTWADLINMIVKALWKDTMLPVNCIIEFTECVIEFLFPIQNGPYKDQYING